MNTILKKVKAWRRQRVLNALQRVDNALFEYDDPSGYQFEPCEKENRLVAKREQLETKLAALV